MRVVNPYGFCVASSLFIASHLVYFFCAHTTSSVGVRAYRTLDIMYSKCNTMVYRRRHHVNREKEFSLVVDLYSRDSQWWWSAHTASCYRLIRQISGCVCVHLFVYVWDCVRRTHYHVKYKMRRRRRLWHFWIDSRQCECVAHTHTHTRLLEDNFVFLLRLRLLRFLSSSFSHSIPKPRHTR